MSIASGNRYDLEQFSVSPFLDYDPSATIHGVASARLNPRLSLPRCYLQGCEI